MFITWFGKPQKILLSNTSIKFIWTIISATQKRQTFYMFLFFKLTTSDRLFSTVSPSLKIQRKHWWESPALLLWVNHYNIVGNLFELWVTTNVSMAMRVFDMTMWRCFSQAAWHLWAPNGISVERKLWTASHDEWTLHAEELCLFSDVNLGLRNHCTKLFLLFCISVSIITVQLLHVLWNMVD